MRYRPFCFAARPVVGGVVATLFLAAANAGLAQVPKPSDVPVGTVLDWWRPDATWPVPDGYQVCDGGVVSDANSPLLNQVLPDLTAKFVLGVTDPGNIGVSGGSAGHDHGIDLRHNHAASSELAGTHAHSADATPPHTHEWIRFEANPNDGKLAVVSWQTGITGTQPYMMFLWTNGIGNSGSGTYPIAIPEERDFTFSTDRGGYHETQISSTRGHVHRVFIRPYQTSDEHTETVDNHPPYVGLLKIMRIR